MQDNVIYLYPTQKETTEIPQNRCEAIVRIARVIAKIIDLFAAIGIMLCIGVCTLLFFTML